MYSTIYKTNPICFNIKKQFLNIKLKTSQRKTVKNIFLYL